MPTPKALDGASVALDKQYRHNLALYKNVVRSLLPSFDDKLVQQEAILHKLQAAQRIARELDQWTHRPELDVDAAKKRIAAHAALVRQVKEARRKIASLSSRLAQRESLHQRDTDVYLLEGAIYQHQKMFSGKRWFIDLRKRLEAFRSFWTRPDAQDVKARLQRLRLTLAGVVANLRAVAIKVNADIDTEKGRRAAIAEVRKRLDVTVRAAESTYRSVAPKGVLRFQIKSGPAGTIVTPSSAELLRDVSSVLSSDWQRLTLACQEIFKLQKNPDSLSAADINQTKAFPAYVVIGGARIASGAFVATVPVLTTFPFKRPRLFREVDQVAPLLLRLIYAMPVGCIRLNVIDHVAVGAHGRDFNQMLDVSDDVVRIITAQDDIRGALQDVLTYMGDLPRTKFTGTITNWSEYNRTHPHAPLPCTILVIYSFKGFESREVELLEPILDRGEQCGVFVVGVAAGLNEMDERLRTAIKLERFAVMPPNLPKGGFAYKKLSVSWQPIARLPTSKWETLMAAYKTAYEAKTSRTSHAFADLYSDVGFWSCNSSEGLDAVIGWDTSDTPLHLRIGFGREGLHHALVGGRSGTGKSNLLHCIIRSLCYRYSPKELTLFLLDFKDGVEFFRYSDSGKSWLPHARTISAHNDPNYALAMLRFIVAEMEMRNDAFKSAGVVGLEEYRVKTGREMPRVLIIVDEASVMFDGEDSRDQIAELVIAILKRGRSAGIHLMLATQTVASFSVRGATEMFQQLAIRLALPGDGDEGILSGVDHSVVRSIRIPQCIYNDNAGAPGCNHVFVHPEFKMDNPSSAEFRHKVDRGVAKLGGWSNFPCRVFNGTVLPPMPPKDQFNALLGKALSGKSRFDLVLGIHNDFVGDVCKVTFEDEAAEDHLLIACEKDERGAAKGLLESFLRSLSALPDKAVLLYNLQRTNVFRLPSGFDVANADTERSELLEKLKNLRDSKAAHKVLMVENFDSARCLHQKNSSPMWGDDNADKTESTDALFKSAFEDSENIPFHVICFTRRVRFAMEKLGNFILPRFSKRIAFGLNGDDLIELMPRARGMNATGKTLFSDESSPDGIIDILPFKSTLKL